LIIRACAEKIAVISNNSKKCKQRIGKLRKQEAMRSTGEMIKVEGVIALWNGENGKRKGKKALRNREKRRRFGERRG